MGNFNTYELALLFSHADSSSSRPEGLEQNCI